MFATRLGNTCPPSLPIAHQTHTQACRWTQADSFLGHPDSIRHKKPLAASWLLQSETQTAAILLFVYLRHRGVRRRPGQNFTALQLKLFHGRERSPAILTPTPTPAAAASLISPCLSLMPNLSLCHFNYSPGNLYGGILQEHQSAKKVISRPATQLWYQ